MLKRLIQHGRRWLALGLGLAAAAAAGQDITVYSSGKVTVGTTRQLSAYVPLSPNTVSWSVNGVTGGNTTYGSVSASGLYTAPTVIPASNAVTVRATSTAFPAKSGAVTLTITQVQPRLWSTSPASVAPGGFTLTLNGAYFKSTSVVNFGGALLPTTYVSSTQLRASGSATTAQLGTQVPVKVQATGLGAIDSDVVQLAVSASTGGTPSPSPSPSPSPTPSVTVGVAPASASVGPLSSQSFSASVTGATNTAVTWSVNGVAGGNSTVGTITSGGRYTAPLGVPSPATVTVRATSAANIGASGSALVTIAPGASPGTSLGTANLSAARLLEQAAFGPSPTDLARVRQIGTSAWIAEQFAMPETPISNPGGMASTTVQQQFLNRLTAAPDQLRQRVAYALAQVIVISLNKNIYPDEIVPYLQTLSRHAFGNYRALLGDISTSPQMGKYLDIANSNKPSAGSAANENFARELMQLFTIGLVRLNPDGTPQLDGQGRTIPTYDQATIQQVALAFTGWTYTGPNNNNWENFSGPMKPVDANHDMRAKSFLGCSLPASQGTVADTNAALDCVFQHPNTAPFVSLRLIRSLVKSNPSPAYVQRVSGVFANNGFGVRGDLKAVVRAVLLDTEARNDTATADAGRLKDPVQHLVSIVRALGGTIAPANQLPWEIGRQGENPLTPPSVFGFYSQNFRVPQTQLAGPEFHIHSPTEAVLRGNLMWRLLTNPGADFTINLTPFSAAAGNTADLINAVDQTFMWGRMPPSMRQVLATAIDNQIDLNQRTQVALLLTLLSGLANVQY